MSSANARPVETITQARHRIAAAAGVALLIAGLVLVLFVLPAEFAVDPFGVGRATGLLDLGVTGQQVEALNASAAARSAAGGPGESASVILPAERPFRQETVTFAIAPREGMEYKYRLAAGEALLFSWSATGPVDFEAHAEPDGAPKGYAQTYEKGTAASAASGTLRTPFAGIHGWYWENTTGEPITVTLSSAGHYTLSHEFRPGQPVRNKAFP